jgi:DNA transposition AAA+ family ATPase
METQQKQHIADEIRAIASKLSQNRVANKAGISAATISQMINGNWSMIKDDMWRKVQSGLRIDLNWRHADTRNFIKITKLLAGTQARGMSIAISFREGHSKSHSYKWYERMADNVIYVECKSYWTKKMYVQALLRAAGLNSEGTVGELIETFIEHVRSLNNPIIIIDQADKLKDPLLDLFMDFYNDLAGACAFLLSGVPALKKRIERGVQRDKIGYRELYSRIGRKFYPLENTTLQDVAAVCVANGLSDENQIIEIFNTCEGDFRRVRREVDKAMLTNKKAA